MPRLTADQWETVRAEREAGTSFPGLAKKFGISHQAIQKRAKDQGWSNGEDVQAIIRRKVAERIGGIVAASNPQKRAAALNDAADRVADVVRKHQQEWADHRSRFGSVPSDFEDGKLAKISAEMLSIRHKGERAAHGLDEAESKPSIVIERSYARPVADPQP